MADTTLPTQQQIVAAINNLQNQITFLYKHLGLIGDPSAPPAIPGDSRRNDVGMGPLLNDRSDFV